MNGTYDAADVVIDSSATQRVSSPTRPLYWSIRREIWENRSIYVAPLLVAGVVFLATFISMAALSRSARAVPARAAQKHASMMKAYHMAPAPIMFTTLLVGLFYSLDALYGERRDRSILFWKSLPVSDRTTVVAKAAIPIVVLPSIALALSIVVQALLLGCTTIFLLGTGMSPVPLFEVEPLSSLIIMIYGLGVHALWFAPIYAWLLMISAWARRAPVLWALVPLLAIAAVERIVSAKWWFMSMLQYRVTGAMREAFTYKRTGNITGLSQLEPMRFVSAPGLWVGLAFAVLFLVAAVRLRHDRQPI